MRRGRGGRARGGGGEGSEAGLHGRGRLARPRPATHRAVVALGVPPRHGDAQLLLLSERVSREVLGAVRRRQAASSTDVKSGEVRRAAAIGKTFLQRWQKGCTGPAPMCPATFTERPVKRSPRWMDEGGELGRLDGGAAGPSNERCRTFPPSHIRHPPRPPPSPLRTLSLSLGRPGGQGLLREMASEDPPTQPAFGNRCVPGPGRAGPRASSPPRPAATPRRRPAPPRPEGTGRRLEGGGRMPPTR